VDAQRFDRMTRRIGTGVDRREVLRLVGAGLLALGGSWPSRHRTQAQIAPGQATCSQDAECLARDADPCTGAACVDGTCTYFIVDCIPGHVCCGNGACCPTGEAAGCLADADCAPAGSDPCEGVRCEGGTCAPFLATCAPDFACCGNGACCPSNGGCVADADCPAFSSPWGTGSRCVSGVCVPPAALP
jgi:hypothetical protein